MQMHKTKKKCIQKGHLKKMFLPTVVTHLCNKISKNVQLETYDVSYKNEHVTTCQKVELQDVQLQALLCHLITVFAQLPKSVYLNFYQLVQLNNICKQLQSIKIANPQLSRLIDNQPSTNGKTTNAKCRTCEQPTKKRDATNWVEFCATKPKTSSISN